MIGKSGAMLLSVGLLYFVAVTPVPLRAQNAPAGQSASQPAGQSASQEDRSTSHFNFAMAHLYGELAGTYGNRGEYVNKAIDFYRQALKIDPTAVYVEEELTQFYVQVGELDKAQTEADAILKAHPDDVNVRKILGRIYSR